MSIVSPADLGLDFLAKGNEGCEPPGFKPKSRPHPLSTDPDLTDPRNIELTTNNQCCACKPEAHPPPPKTYDLKSKPLHSCYWCCPSKECIHQENVRCNRWQQYCYKHSPESEQLFCNGRFLEVPGRKEPEICDFTPVHKKLEIGPREKETLEYIRAQATQSVCKELEAMNDRGGPSPRRYCRPETLSEMDEEARVSTYVTEDPYTFWYQRVRSTRRYVEGATPFPDRMRPFRKNTAFTSAVLEPL